MDQANDFLVIGSGIAGLWFSHRVRRAGRVVVITKKADTESNTNYAQGGIAAAVDSDDSAQLHSEDTLRAGAGLVRPEIVKLVTEAGPDLVRQLFDIGVSFDLYSDAAGNRRFDLGQEGGHRRRRIVHAHDHTGFEIERGLLSAVRSNPNVTVIQDHFAADLALDANGRCCGAWVVDEEAGRVEFVGARTVLLATGGIGQAWQFTTNPRIATGDGIAMAFRAGARVANMEFVQFHPTSLYGHRIDDRAFLISEAVRGEGAILRRRDGYAFMPDYHPDADLAPRDVVARAIVTELKKTGDDYVLLDVTHLEPARTRARFPYISETCLKLGIDITREPIPVVPAAHYLCGGVRTNEWAETSVPALFAAGECACTGLHGANRLASNSLLEALVFADRAATRALATASPGSAPGVPAGPRPAPAGSARTGRGEDLLRRLQRTMWQCAGIVRNDAGLVAARAEIAGMQEEARSLGSGAAVDLGELGNLLAVARMVVECALRRPESRGLHFNEDHPQTDDRYRVETVIGREDLAS